MRLFAYNQIGKNDELVIWVGVTDTAHVPAVTFEFEVYPHPPRPLVPRNAAINFMPLGDQVCNAAGKPLNHRATFVFDWPDTDARFNVRVSCGNQHQIITSRRLPSCLPTRAQGGFYLLLSSCYYEPNDRKRPLGLRVKNLKPQPDLTLLAGDQVYLDLPSMQNLPTPKNKLAQTLGKKYRDNWFAPAPDRPGLSTLLAHGPVICLPDDHEYWNNYPLAQAQLNNTHAAQNRQNWSNCAAQLFADYQMAPIQTPGFVRVDMEPLSLLFLDSRSTRDAQGKCMFTEAAKHALNCWKNDLLHKKAQGLPAVGLLSSGQALMIDAAGWPEKYLADMEMPNYQDFENLKAAIEELIRHGVPVIYITGDVHWGRIIEGRNHVGKPLFYEVIASPSRLLDTLGTDQWRSIKNKVSGLFGQRDDFPLHCPAPDKLPNTKLAGLRFSVMHRQRGDHVAMLRFHRTTGGMDMYVDYHCTDANENLHRQHSSTHGPFHLTSV